MEKLLTKREVAERWQVTEKAIDNWRKQGLISTVDGVPAVRFNPQHIAELEGTRLEKYSPIERRKMEAELNKFRKENEDLKNILSKVLGDLAPVLKL